MNEGEKGMEVICLGELLLDMVAQQGEDGRVSGFTMKPGGAAGNVAVAVSRLGGRAGVLAKVSGDFFGETMKRTMEENGVDASGLILDPARKIALAFVTFDAEKKPDYLFYRENSASASMCPEELRAECFRGARALYFSSMGLVRDPMRAAHYEAVRLARANGARVAFDPNIRFGVWPSKDAARGAVLEMLRQTNILKVNDEELAFLFGEGAPADRCPEIFAAHPELELIAVTLGADGAFLMTRDGLQARVGALDTRVVDTVGAGDSFFATLIHRLIDCNFAPKTNEKLTEIAQYANAAALITAKRPGAIPAMPAWAEVEALRRRY